jgi:nucleotide-binding universal stress UspA family protein
MLKHILVPLDGSQLAEEALPYAREIVDPNGKITLVAAVNLNEASIYTYYPAVNLPKYEQVIQDILPTAKHYLQGMAEQMNDGRLMVVFEAQIGDPADVIIEAAEKYEVDAIVMSSHGRSGLTRWLMGSVTQKVLDAKPCPVFVVPNKKPEMTKQAATEATFQ